jgi:hypothetical protein
LAEHSETFQSGIVVGDVELLARLRREVDQGLCFPSNAFGIAALSDLSDALTINRLVAFPGFRRAYL